MPADDLGETGETLFANLCARAGLDCNGSDRDRTGWDFTVEFADIVGPLDHRRKTVCHVQVKATRTVGNVPLTLSSARLLAMTTLAARTNWHRHPLGQLLVVTEGHGLIQDEGGPVRAIAKGDTVWTAPGIMHSWHRRMNSGGQRIPQEVRSGLLVSTGCKLERGSARADFADFRAGWLSTSIVEAEATSLSERQKYALRILISF